MVGQKIGRYQFGSKGTEGLGKFTSLNNRCLLQISQDLAYLESAAE